MIGQSEEGQALLSKAEEDFQQSIMIAKSVYDSLEGDRAKAAGNYAYALERVASVHRLQGRIEDAKNLFQKAVSLREEALLVARTEDSLNYRLASLGREQANYADFLISLGPNSDSSELEFMVSNAIRNLEKAGGALVETDSLLSPVLRDLGIAYSVAAKYFESLGKDNETREFYVKAIDVNRKLVEKNVDRVGFKNNLIRTSYDYGDYLLVHAASAEEARDVYVPAILSVREMLADPSLEELEQEGLAMGYYRLGLVSIGMGNREKAVRYFGRCALIRDLRYREMQDTAEYRADPDVALTMYIELLLPLAYSGQTAEAISGARDLVLRMQEKDEATTANVGNYLAQAAFVLAIASEHLSSKDKEEIALEAIQVLELAIEKGYNDILYLQSDPDVAALRSIPGSTAF